MAKEKFYKAEWRAATADTIDGWFITGPSITGHIYEEHDGKRMADLLNDAFIAGLKAAEENIMVKNRWMNLFALMKL